jgi:hypothetical protein
MDKELIARILIAVARELTTSPTLTPPQASLWSDDATAIEHARILIEKSPVESTRTFMKGVVQFYESAGHLSDKQRQSIESTYKMQIMKS